MWRQSIQTKWTAPSRLTSALVHLARGHGEFAVLDLARAADMTVDLHVVGRIGENGAGTVFAHQMPIGIGILRIAANELVTPEMPDIAGSGDCGARYGLGNIIGGIAVAYIVLIEK
jgi:hypothetical protein